MRPAVTIQNDKEIEKMPKWPSGKEGRQYRAEERARMLKKQHLMREIELGALNTKRYRTLWREMMMRVKMPQIAEDIEIAWRNFERILDIKDYRISFLMDELAEAEEQYQRNVRSHLETIDQSLRKYKKRMDYKEGIYQRILNEMLVETDTEVNKINHHQNEDEILLQSITRGVQQQSEESLNNAKSITLSKIDAFVEDSKNIRRMCAAQLENQLQSFCEDLRQVLSDYQNKTKERRKYYDAIKEKDEEDQQIIARQLSRTVNLFEDIQKFREKITTYDTTAKEETSEIRIEHDFFQNAYWTMKNRFISEQTKDKNQLKILSIEYNKVTKYLKSLDTKAKQLLSLMQICRKYETQEEKILAFANDTNMEDLLTPSSHRASISPNWNISHEIIKNFEDLTNFWRRLGAAQITTAELRLERDKLKTEANYLYKYLNSYITQNVKK